MDVSTMITIGTGVAGSVGGYFGGRVFGSQASVDTAANLVDMMKTEVDILKDKVRQKDDQLTDLTSRVGVLESLVTQRAEVEAVHETVREVKGTVERIATKVGA